MEQDAANRIAKPTMAHPFGTDKFGRDLLSRVIWGSRISLTVGFSAVVIGVGTGLVLGVVSGYFGGLTDTISMRLADIILAFPGVLLALGLVVGLGTGLHSIILAIAIWRIPSSARIVRGATLSAKEMDYVQAAIVLGASHFRVMVRHILPNVIMPLVVYATLTIATAILMEATLSFLGAGVQPPTPTWGNICSEGRTLLRIGPWISVFPGVFIMLVVLGFNLMGDALRDAFDPRLRGEA
jgi:ABC-type dipeptide/oligopeptide/nickel transport system permease subunit